MPEESQPHLADNAQTKVPRKASAAGLIAAVAIIGVVAGVSSGCGSVDDARRFEVSVQFTTEATQDDILDVGAFLRTYDEDLEYLILEIFPPIGRAVVPTEAADFCHTVETELGAKSYVDDVSCGPHVEADESDANAPVNRYRY